jgi:hypothetical protein
MATKTAQQPGGTRRQGIGDRPFQSYSILQGENGSAVQLGLTRRVVKDGKQFWQAENGKATSPDFKVHRDAVLWLLGSLPEAPQVETSQTEATEPKDLEQQLAEAIEAKESDPKEPVSEVVPGESAPEAPEVAPDVTPDHDTRDKDAAEHEDESHLDVDHPALEQPKAPPAAAANARRHMTGRSKSTKARALVDGGLADNQADAKAMLEDMGEEDAELTGKSSGSKVA